MIDIAGKLAVGWSVNTNIQPRNADDASENCPQFRPSNEGFCLRVCPGGLRGAPLVATVTAFVYGKEAKPDEKGEA